MLFKRKAYDELLKWKKSFAGEKALLIEGARRIGKSTLAEEFGRREYKSYLLIDFNDASKATLNIFEEKLGDLDTFFMLLSAEYGKTLYPGESLIIFDEIQMYPKARQSIKALVKDGRFDYIETGSLISIKENVGGITIPSEERRLKMYPMCFEEFCMALGEDVMLEYILHCFNKKEALTNELHKKAMLLFKQYILVGGMPQSVKKFIEGGRDFAAADAEKRDILNLYRNDIMKIDGRYRARVSSIFEQIPGFLSQHEKRVRLSNIEDGSSLPMYEETFFWLGNSMIANECYSVSEPALGLSFSEKRSAVKCYMGDTGLLFSHAFNEKEIAEGKLYWQILNDKLSLNKGMLFENAIAQELTSRGHELFFYTRYNPEKHRNDMEIDFLLANGSKTKPMIIPVEVKSGKRYTTVSLTRFVEHYKKQVQNAYIIHPKNLSEDGGILKLPAYMSMCL